MKVDLTVLTMSWGGHDEDINERSDFTRMSGSGKAVKLKSLPTPKSLFLMSYCSRLSRINGKGFILKECTTPLLQYNVLYNIGGFF